MLLATLNQTRYWSTWVSAHHADVSFVARYRQTATDFPRRFRIRRTDQGHILSVLLNSEWQDFYVSLFSPATSGLRNGELVCGCSSAIAIRE